MNVQRVKNVNLNVALSERDFHRMERRLNACVSERDRLCSHRERMASLVYRYNVCVYFVMNSYFISDFSCKI